MAVSGFTTDCRLVNEQIASQGNFALHANVRSTDVMIMNDLYPEELRLRVHATFRHCFSEISKLSLCIHVHDRKRINILLLRQWTT